MRKQREFDALAVIVFTGSSHPGDEKKAHDLGANACEIKPQGFEEFSQLVKKMADFWLRGR